MMSRRDVVTGGVIGTLAASAVGEPAGVAQTVDTVVLERGLAGLRQQLELIKTVLDDGMRQQSLTFGLIVPVRRAFELFLKVNGKFPDYIEVGTGVFFDVYDWHVRHGQAITVSRLADSRTAIQFMFTQLILRYEQDPAFVGVPFDRA
jgi:hypothetical protein